MPPRPPQFDPPASAAAANLAGFLSWFHAPGESVYVVTIERADGTTSEHVVVADGFQSAIERAVASHVPGPCAVVGGRARSWLQPDAYADFTR